MTTGIIIALTACAIAIIGIVRNNKADPKESGFLRLNRIGFLLLLLSGISLLAAIAQVIMAEREKINSQRTSRQHEDELRQRLSEIVRQGENQSMLAQEMNLKLTKLVPKASAEIRPELMELAGLSDAIVTGRRLPLSAASQPLAGHSTPEWVPIHPRANPEEVAARTDERGNSSGSFSFSIAIFENIGITEWYEKELTRAGFKTERGKGTLLLDAHLEPEGSGTRRSISLNLHSAFRMTVSWEERKQ